VQAEIDVQPTFGLIYVRCYFLHIGQGTTGQPLIAIPGADATDIGILAESTDRDRVP
jgi:hypothetical protein